MKKRLRQVQTSTTKALAYFQERLSQLGTVNTVTVCSRDMRVSRGTDTPFTSYDCPRVYIRGDRANMALYGLLWGYSGEGPRGLHTVLSTLGFSLSMDEIKALDRNRDSGYTFRKTATGTAIIPRGK